jgi:protein-disulfide isomerase
VAQDKISPEKTSPEKAEEEPLFLSMLPFAGLGLLLLLALVWRYIPRDEPSTPPPPPPPEESAALAIANFEQMPQRPLEVSPADFSLGPANAPVTVVEFSDFECPFCRRGAEAVREVLAKHPEEVRLVFKDFPIDIACHDALEQQLHPFACKAALLARCAGRSNAGLFWQAHDALFRATELSEDVLGRIAVELSLEIGGLNRCMASPEPLAKVKEDIALGRKLGVTGTPTFFVNGRRAPEYTNGALLQVVEHVLATPAQK